MKKLLLLFFLIPQVVFGVTWNPSDKDADITLSGSDLVAVNGVAGWNSVRADISKSSGKWYWEVLVESGGTMIGIANSSASLNTFIGGDANGWSFYLNGQKYTNNSGSAYGSAYTYTDIVGIAMDLDNDTVAFYINGVLQGTAFTSLTGTYYPAVGISAVNGRVTGQFATADLTYSPPSGYNAFDYSAPVPPPDFGNYATGTALTSGDTTITFQLAVIIFILFLMVVGMFYNNLNKRQSWR